MTDYPRREILEMARDAVVKLGGPGRAMVYFKFTCGKCGERCTFAEPNKLHESGECSSCGHVTVVEVAGFALVLGAGLGAG